MFVLYRTELIYRNQIAELENAANLNNLGIYPLAN